MSNQITCVAIQKIIAEAIAEGIPIDVNTIKYGQLYWITIGTSGENVFYQLDLVNKVFDKTERWLDHDKPKNFHGYPTYNLGSHLSRRVNLRGQAELMEYIFQNQYV